MRRLLVVAILGVLYVAGGASLAAPPQRFEYSEVAMGVRARMVLYAGDQGTAQAAARAAYDRIAYLEQIMSDYRPDSEISMLSAKAGGPAVQISPELFDILAKAQELARRSDGAFDVTVGPLVKLWRVARKSGKMPPMEQLEAARKLVGWRKLHIEKRGLSPFLGMQLDLGGIAKGYGCDEAIRVLREHGVKSALVEMGGDIVVSDAPPGTKGWEIEIENARPHRTEVLANAAVSSSGDVEQFVEIGGKRYSHIVDPRTGLGITDRIAVTIIAPNGTTSDGLSTAVSVLGAVRGKTLANTYPGVRLYVRS